MVQAASFQLLLGLIGKAQMRDTFLQNLAKPPVHITR
jgi:hypothetical protein